MLPEITVKTFRETTDINTVTFGLEFLSRCIQDIVNRKSTINKKTNKKQTENYEEMPNHIEKQSRMNIPDRSSNNNFRRRNKKSSKKSQQFQFGSMLSSSSNDGDLYVNQSQSRVALQKTLTDIGCYRTDDSTRRQALEYIDSILQKWATKLMPPSVNLINDTMNSENTKTGNLFQRPRVALIPFGSYRLGVHRPESDLDILALAPPPCTRQDFFTSLVQLLSDDPEISQLHPINSAYTPVIKFSVKSFQVDLVFAGVNDATKLLKYHQSHSVALQSHTSPQSSPRDFLTNTYTIDDTDLVGLDEVSVRSINGARVCQMLLEYVEPYCSLESYRVVLRAVKQWAIKTGIYSNVLGFLGGINWAILVAFVCRSCNRDKKSPAYLLKCFFRIFASWQWPTPVMIASCQEKPNVEGVPYFPSWNNVTNPRDGLHVMPIITPAYPCMNSSYNVGFPQLRRIQYELIKASNHLTQQPNNFDDLLVKESDFFRSYVYFVQIKIWAMNQQDFVEWFRLVESRLRQLINAFDTPSVEAWPFAKFFERKYNGYGVCEGELKEGEETDEHNIHERIFFIGLKFAPGLESIDLRDYASDFLFRINSWSGRKAGMEVSIECITSDSLPSFILGCAPELSEESKLSHSGDNQYTNNSENMGEEIDDSIDPACDYSTDASIPTMETENHAHEMSSPLKKCRVMAK